MLRTTPLLRQLPATLQSTRTAAASFARQSSHQQIRCAHAISNPTLANIEKRWEAMPPSEQAELWMALRDRMKVDWKDLTMQEKKAGMCYSAMAFQCLWRGYGGGMGIGTGV
jgi:cytochrome c oxidase subunit 4